MCVSVHVSVHACIRGALQQRNTGKECNRGKGGMYKSKGKTAAGTHIIVLPDDYIKPHVLVPACYVLHGRGTPTFLIY